MDTKSKNTRYAAWIKLLAALLCVIGPLAAAWGLRQAYYFHSFQYGDDYVKSGDYTNDIIQYYGMVRSAGIDDDKSVLKDVNSRQGMLYYVKRADGTVLTNLPQGANPDDTFNQLDGRIVAEFSPNSEYAHLEDGAGYDFSYFLPPKGAVIYVGMAQETLRHNAYQYQADRRLGIQGVYLLGGGALAYLLGLAWLIYASGRQPGVEGVRLAGYDAFYLDVGLAVTVIVATFCSLGLVFFYRKVFFASSINMTAAYVMIALLAECMAASVALWLTSAARRLKRHEFIRHTLIYEALAWAGRIARDALGAGVLALKATLLFAGYVIASMLMFCFFIEATRYSGNAFAGVFAFLLFVGVNAAALVYILRKVASLRKMLQGVEAIRSGNLAYRVPGTGGAPFPELAAGLNGIAEGLSAAVENEVKAERMKAELITNVSHDLKTPLTSIITYIDLLKSEGPGSEHAEQYIGVLDAKARRLKALTDDLFEAAKAASGSLKLSLERLDVGELIEQGLGELSDRIRESGLDFRFAPPDKKLLVVADGKMLWRVMENLFSNAFKYAQPASRVYIAAAAAAGRVVITVKNISAAELNMPAEALMERFTRGDASRHSEGSGLGLAIAKSLVELQGGRFFIDIDGDLFKAGIELPCAEG